MGTVGSYGEGSALWESQDSMGEAYPLRKAALYGEGEAHCALTAQVIHSFAVAEPSHTVKQIINHKVDKVN